MALTLPADGNTSWGEIARAAIQAVNSYYGSDHGFLTWSIDAAFASSSSLPTAGVVNLVRVRVPHAATVTSVGLHVATAGATLTGCFAGLYNASGTRLGLTVDQSTAWTTGGFKDMALTSAASVSAGLYYVSFVVGTATTAPAFARASSSSSANVGLSAPSLRFALSGTGQTSLPASITMASITSSNVSYLATLME